MHTRIIVRTKRINNTAWIINMWIEPSKNRDSKIKLFSSAFEKNIKKNIYYLLTFIA